MHARGVHYGTARRSAAPELMSSWPGLVDAARRGPACPQPPSRFGRVRQISAFGRDPENVTIFGQSGGGDSVQSLLLSADAAVEQLLAVQTAAGRFGLPGGMPFSPILGRTPLPAARRLTGSPRWHRVKLPTGSTRHDDLPFVFGTPATRSDAPMLAVEVRRCWTDFAHRGIDTLPSRSLLFGDA